jgi:hypothetical protein
MHRFTYLISIFSILSIASFSQTILTTPIANNSFCEGANFNISYSLTGSFMASNEFTAQLSDPSGNFTTPTDIGNLISSSEGSINVTIPTNLVSSSLYRIRIISSNPSVIGADNGNDLTINTINLNPPSFLENIFCPGNSFTVSFSFTSACDFLGGNIFTAQLSDPNGSFATPISLQSTTRQTAGSYTVTIPTITPPGSAYRLRMVSSNPVRVGPDNGTNLIINPFGIDQPIFNGTSFCQSEKFTIEFNINNGCVFPYSPLPNIFTAQLSSSTGSFTTPINIGSIEAVSSGFIEAIIPSGTTAGLGYRIRVVSSNPTTISSPDNGINLTINASSGDPNIFGSTSWNAYVYKGTNPAITNNSLLGKYSETNLSFSTNDRWNPIIGPGTTNGLTGDAYEGCPVSEINYSISFKRTNFACGYYQIDIPFQDDKLTLLINGLQVFQSNDYTPNLRTNIWSGFLGSTSTVEFQFVNFGGPGNLQVVFKPAPNPLNVSDSSIICTGSTVTLTVSSLLFLNYSWTPIASLSPSNGIGATVEASPPETTMYTVKGVDAITGCSITQDVVVAVTSPETEPIITLTTVPSSICSGITESKIKVTGANTYIWEPDIGLSSTSGSSVIANPPVTTTYTVTGSTGCRTATTSTTVYVQLPDPPVTEFGDNTWNVYCHNNTTVDNYYGFYTENNLNINTTSRWDPAIGPTTANASSGLPYTGCSFGSNNYSMSFKRTNFKCGYYQIDIPFQDDGIKIIIDGLEVFQNSNFTPSIQTNVWTGFLGQTSTVEIQLVNSQLEGELKVSIFPSIQIPQVINSNSTICVETEANLSVTSPIIGASYEWSVNDPSSTITISNPSIENPVLQTTTGTPIGDYEVTNLLTDIMRTGCSSTKSFIVSVGEQANTTIEPISAINILTDCTNFGVTLTAGGANTYTWSPSAGLSSTTGFSVIAKPLVTTTYTVIGDNNCSSKSATTTVTVSPLPAINIYPTNTWNVYGFNSLSVGMNYQGYYTENGLDEIGLNFDTRTRWSSNVSPSYANGSTGTEWQGCDMDPTNTSLSFKRSGFACGIYQLDVPAHDGAFLLIINGDEITQHNGCCDNHTNVWTGSLNSNSTVEWQLQNNSGNSYLQVAFKRVPLPDFKEFPTSAWNIYGFNSTTFGTDYQGYYTEHGSGNSGLSFDTRTRWASDDLPSNTNDVNGILWQGCDMNDVGTSLSIKRTGFPCGMYQLNVSEHADSFTLFINDQLIAQHNVCCDSHNNIWTGTLNNNSTIEWRLIRSDSESYLKVEFIPIFTPIDQTIWFGGTSTDWFDASNWCDKVPSPSIDVIIPASGPQNMPIISTSGASARSITINPGIGSNEFTTVIPDASLTLDGINLDISGSWINKGKFLCNNCSVSFIGNSIGNFIQSTSKETFRNLLINKPNDITILSGEQEVAEMLSFISGRIIQNSTLRILNGGNITGASNTSYINGSISKIGNSTFTFPVGKDGILKPIIITAPELESDEFRVQYFNLNPSSSYPITQHAETLNRVSSKEYWILDRLAGESNVKVTLSFNSDSEKFSSLSSLRVAGWDGSIWKDLGNGGTSGSITSGTLTSAFSSTTFGPFTLGESQITVGIEDERKINTNFILYPNPASNIAFIDNLGLTPTSITLINYLGKEIKCLYTIESENISIDTSALSPGLYIININVDQKYYSIKLIIQK